MWCVTHNLPVGAESPGGLSFCKPRWALTWVGSDNWRRRTNDILLIITQFPLPQVLGEIIPYLVFGRYKIQGFTMLCRAILGFPGLESWELRVETWELFEWGTWSNDVVSTGLNWMSWAVSRWIQWVHLTALKINKWFFPVQCNEACFHLFQWTKWKIMLVEIKTLHSRLCN